MRSSEECLNEIWFRARTGMPVILVGTRHHSIPGASVHAEGVVVIRASRDVIDRISPRIRSSLTIVPSLDDCYQVPINKCEGLVRSLLRAGVSVVVAQRTKAIGSATSQCKAAEGIICRAKLPHPEHGVDSKNSAAYVIDRMLAGSDSQGGFVCKVFRVVAADDGIRKNFREVH